MMLMSDIVSHIFAFNVGMFFAFLVVFLAWFFFDANGGEPM